MGARALLVLALVSAAPTALAQSTAALRAEAERRNARGNQLYQAGRYEEALRAYQAAHALHPDARYVFNSGLAREKIFDYVGCALAFRQFLAEAGDIDAAARAKAEQRLSACRERARIPVRFTSAPTNAGIYVGEGENRRLVGRTPQTVDLAPGRYVVTMELAGYVPRSDTIDVELGDASPQVDYVLDKLSSLRIEVDPAGARVKIDDFDWESAPAKREVRPGTHQVWIQKAGYIPVTREIKVEPGAEVSLVLSLQPLPRVRRLSLRPSAPVPAARVRIDGQDGGGFPVTRRVSPGSHRVEISAPGRIPFARDIAIPEDRDLRLVVHLEPERSRRDRLIVWGLAGGSGVAAVVGAVYGALALRDQARFADDPNPMLERQGEDRAEKADVWFATAAVLGGGAALYYWLTSPGESTARVEY